MQHLIINQPNQVWQLKKYIHDLFDVTKFY